MQGKQLCSAMFTTPLELSGVDSTAVPTVPVVLAAAIGVAPASVESADPHDGPEAHGGAKPAAVIDQNVGATAIMDGASTSPSSCFIFAASVAMVRAQKPQCPYRKSLGPKLLRI